MERKLLKVNKPGERIKNIYVETEEDLVEDQEEEEEENVKEVENTVTTQTDTLDFSQSCSTQTEECDYMFSEQKPWLHESLLFLRRIISKVMTIRSDFTPVYPQCRHYEKHFPLYHHVSLGALLCSANFKSLFWS